MTFITSSLWVTGLLSHSLILSYIFIWKETTIWFAVSEKRCHVVTMNNSKATWPWNISQLRIVVIFLSLSTSCWFHGPYFLNGTCLWHFSHTFLQANYGSNWVGILNVSFCIKTWMCAHCCHMKQSLPCDLNVVCWFSLPESLPQ